MATWLGEKPRDPPHYGTTARPTLWNNDVTGLYIYHAMLYITIQSIIFQLMKNKFAVKLYAVSCQQ